MIQTVLKIFYWITTLDPYSFACINLAQLRWVKHKTVAKAPRKKSKIISVFKNGTSHHTLGFVPSRHALFQWPREYCINLKSWIILEKLCYFESSVGNSGNQCSWKTVQTQAWTDLTGTHGLQSILPVSNKTKWKQKNTWNDWEHLQMKSLFF